MSTHTTTDVIIVGAGVIGSSIAYHLRKAGVEVLVIERDEIAAEASSAAAGLLAPLGALTGPGAFTDLALASWFLAPEVFPEIEAASGIKVEYTSPGSLRIITNVEEVTTLRQRLTAWEAMKVQIQWLTGAEALQLEPLLRPDVYAAVYAPDASSIRPPSVTRAYAEAARRLGARFITHSEVTGIEHHASRVTGVKTARGETFRSQHLVLASGAWSASFGDWLGFSLPIVPMKGQILALRQPEPALTHVLFDGNIYMVPKPDNTIFVGATVEQVGFDKRLTAGGISWLLKSAIQLAPSLEHAEIADMWAGLRPWSPDSRPILGKAPGWENVTIATGHSAMGFELSIITGRTITELITTQQTPELIRTFGVERFL